MASSIDIKVYYVDVLKRFNANLNEKNQLDFDVTGLRAKIISLFKILENSSFIMRYMDEDDKLVTLEDDDDLNDVMNHQKLKFLTLYVERTDENGESCNNAKKPFMNWCQNLLFNPFGSKAASSVSVLPETLDDVITASSMPVSSPKVIDSEDGEDWEIISLVKDEDVFNSVSTTGCEVPETTSMSTTAEYCTPTDLSTKASDDWDWECEICGMLIEYGFPHFAFTEKNNYALCSLCFDEHANDNETDNSIIDILVNMNKSESNLLNSQMSGHVDVLYSMTVAPSSVFTKIWSMENCGISDWLEGTQFVRTGGDKFSDFDSVNLQEGVPVGDKFDVAVEFRAPKSPGCYTSSWRMASSTGKRFGERVEITIKVVDASFKDSSIQDDSQVLDLNISNDDSVSNDSGIVDINFQNQKIDNNKQSKPQEVESGCLMSDILESRNPKISVKDLPLAPNLVEKFGCLEMALEDMKYEYRNLEECSISDASVGSLSLEGLGGS